MKEWFEDKLALCWVALIAVLVVFGSPVSAQTASDYTQSMVSSGSNQATITFKPTTAASLVDVHYNAPGLPTQSFRMTNNAGTWTRIVGGLNAGHVVEYWFTYEKRGPLYNTPHFFYTHGGGSGGGTVATPTFAPGAGTYSGTQSVSITTATSGATIRYTNNGTTPTATSPQYTGPINVATSQTLKAIAIKSGMTNSAVATAAYTINPVNGGTVAVPSFNPPGGTYAAAKSVSLASATSGATIYYTTNGSTPTTASPVYAGAIGVAGNTTIKAFAAKSGMSSSAVATQVYTISTQAANGRFPIVFVNNTRGIWRDDQIYIWGLSLNEQGIWCYMKPDGSLVPMRKADENAPGHLVKNGRNYANYAFTVAQAKAANFRSWTHVRGGRLYISVGSPVYIPVDDNAWGGPDLLNPNDPNIDIAYDWYEYTYVHNTDVAFGGNTGMVDQFGVPLTHRVVNAALGMDVTKGTTGTRDAIINGYKASVPPAFQGLASNPMRIKAPYKDSFRPGFANANYLQPYIDQVWNQYTANEFRLQRLGDLFVGRVINNRLQFTKNGIGPFFIDKPTTFDVFACSGALARGAQTELELEAELCGAFNRGVAQTTSNYANPSSYYLNNFKNEYAAFWHKNGIGGKAYAFAYDDTNDQSTVIVIPNLASRPYPDSVTITIGW